MLRRTFNSWLARIFKRPITLPQESRQSLAGNALLLFFPESGGLRNLGENQSLQVVLKRVVQAHHLIGTVDSPLHLAYCMRGDQCQALCLALYFLLQLLSRNDLIYHTDL